MLSGQKCCSLTSLTEDEAACLHHKVQIGKIFSVICWYLVQTTSSLRQKHVFNPVWCGKHSSASPIQFPYRSWNSFASLIIKKSIFTIFFISIQKPNIFEPVLCRMFTMHTNHQDQDWVYRCLCHEHEETSTWIGKHNFLVSVCNYCDSFNTV